MLIQILPVQLTKKLNKMEKIKNKKKNISPLKTNAIKGNGWVLNSRLSTQKLSAKK